MTWHDTDLRNSKFYTVYFNIGKCHLCELNVLLLFSYVYFSTIKNVYYIGPNKI